MRLRTPAAVALATALLVLPACSGDSPTPENLGSPESVLSDAAAKLVATSGVDLTITSAGLPERSGGFVLVGGSGVAVNPDSFEGSLKVRAMGMTADADVIAADGKVWISTPILGSGFQEVDPDAYGMPDVEKLLAADGGVPELLANTTNLERGGQIRGGEDNKEVLTEYTGTLTQEQIRAFLKRGTGDFKVRYEIDDEGYLTAVEVTGGFYEGEPATTYSIDLDTYDVKKKITAP